MLYRKFGKLEFHVSEIAFGGGAISGDSGGYSFGNISEKDSIDLLKYAFDLGINIFDSAPIYGFGSSEKRIGKAFKSQREKVFLVTKGGVTWHKNKRVDLNNSPDVIERMLERSLQDLDTDYIDLYMIHWPDRRVDIRDTMEVLVRAQNAGKIHYLGLSNTNIDEIEKAQEIGNIDIVQGEMNLFNTAVRRELFPTILKHELGFMAYGTFEKGILTGTVNADRKFSKSDCRSWAPWWKKMDKAPRFRAMERITSFLKQTQFSPIDLAIHFNLSNPEVSTTICGARTIPQLDQVVKSLDNRPTAEVVEKVLLIIAEEFNAAN